MSLLLHLLQKMVSDRATYERAIRELSQEEKIEVKIPREQFEVEARDYNLNLSHFYKASAFNDLFILDGRHIMSRGQI